MITITGGQLPTSGGTMTGPLAIAAGSAAAPGLAVAGASNTGLWAPTADTLAVATAGGERIRFGPNIGIGTMNPGAKLEVNGGGANTQVNILSGNDANLSRLMIGRAALTAMVGVSASAGQLITGDVAGDFAIRNYGNNILFSTDNGVTSQLYLKNGGNVGIGTTSPTAALHVPASTTVRASLRIPAGTAPTIPNAGDVWAEGAVLKFYNGTITKEFAFV